MVEVKYWKWGIPIKHIWFYSNSNVLPTGNERNKSRFGSQSKDALIFSYHDVELSEIPYVAKIKGCIISSSTQYSLLTDLTENEDEIWKNIKKNYRYEINRSNKEGDVMKLYTPLEVINNDDLVSKFKQTYNEMFTIKGINNKFNEHLFKTYLDNGVLYITTASQKNQLSPSVFHAYITDGMRSRFWYSCSTFRDNPEEAEAIGRMNKALHWFDLIELKRLGVTSYDWGGVNYEDKALKGISDFKSRFGGRAIEYNNIIMARSAVIARIVNAIINKK